METSLHRQLKELYADDDSQTEVQLGDFRIDAIFQDQLVEIQHGSLAAIHDKIKKLLVSHRVMVVKPIILRKQLVKCSSRGGPVVDRPQWPSHRSRREVVWICLMNSFTSQGCFHIVILFWKHR